MHLSQAQVSNYQENGYLFPLDLAESLDMKKIKSDFDRLQVLQPPSGINKPMAGYLRQNAQYLFPLINQIALFPDLLDKVESILGDTLLLYSAEFFIKEPQTNKVVTWHQDLTYWGLGETDDEITAWVALSDVNVESGCMQFIAGSHKNRILPHQDSYSENNLLSRGQEIAIEIDEKQAVNIELMPGQVSFHHGRIFHASGPNRSHNQRIGLALRYIKPSVQQQFNDHDYAILARGQDQSEHWRYVKPPKENFDPDNFNQYHDILAEQKKILMRV
ncbi:MAG: ectoine hydroxylase-related dioxygenase (phytanoyl-CoA dioxygenase family) [Gammaproteobacteria bacterium]|jgi:ectoine hydroxylase-related dioxygenase (phytanoyl-CoA dioxygenase family)